MDESVAIQPGTVVAGKLRVVRLIGEGGMGAVYEVEHELTKHRRALKMLHAEMTQIPGVVARFLREASAAGRIGSPHIVETFDAGQLDSGEPYIVMEMLNGKPLDHFIESKGRLDPGEAIEILKQACDGIQAAHDAGIIHRDLKPENLFLTKGDKLFVKILDFGISKFDSQRTGDHKLTVEGTALGTPFYMPPEQVRGEADIDARADVYALGVVLYECLTGQKPFVAETLPHLAVLIHEGNYEPLSNVRPDAPPGLAQVVARAMAKDRTARYPTVRALRESLDEIETGDTPGDAPKARSSTLIAPASMTGGFSAGANNPSTPGAPAPTSALAGAETGTGLALSTATAPQKRFPKGIVAAAVAALAVLGAFVAFTAKPSAPDVASEPPRAASPVTPAPTPSPEPPPTPKVAPAVAAPTAAESPAPSASVSAAPPAVPIKTVVAPHAPEPKRPAATPAPAAKKPGGTRAAQHGLSEENPF